MPLNGQTATPFKRLVKALDISQNGTGSGHAGPAPDSLESQLDKSRLPRHVAIIMDGNGRWARKQGLERIFGHKNGVSAVRNAAEACAELGIECLTLYAFSTENWSRPQPEVNALMELLVHTIRDERPTLHKNGIRLQAIGDIASLPAQCQADLSTAIAETAHHNRMTLVLALSYSARWDILKAVKKIAREAASGSLNPAEINEQCFAHSLSTAAYPDPELLIRTSGEHRVSNFLLWELAYAEFYFTDTLWPDFEKEDLYRALNEYQRRERRFGLTSEQLTQ